MADKRQYKFYEIRAGVKKWGIIKSGAWGRIFLASVIIESKGN